MCITCEDRKDHEKWLSDELPQVYQDYLQGKELAVLCFQAGEAAWCAAAAKTRHEKRTINVLETQGLPS